MSSRLSVLPGPESTMKRCSPAMTAVLTPVRRGSGIGEPLRRYAWPGNVRELQNVIERLSVELTHGDTAGDGVLTREVLRTVAPEILEPAGAGGAAATTLRERSRHVEAEEIRAVLAACSGDRDAACKALGISKTTLWRKLNVAQ